MFQRFLCCFFWTSADFSCFQHFFFFFFIFFSRTAHMAVCVSPLIFTCTSLASRSRSYFKGKVFLSAGLTFQMNVRNPQLDSILFTFFSQNECEVLVSWWFRKKVDEISSASGLRLDRNCAHSKLVHEVCVVSVRKPPHSPAELCGRRSRQSLAPELKATGLLLSCWRVHGLPSARGLRWSRLL